MFEELLGRGMLGRLLLNHGRLIRLLTLQVREHNLSKFHELLGLLFRNLPHDLKGLHTTIGRLGHGPELIQDRLLSLQLTTLQADRFQRAERRIQCCRRPFLVVRIIGV